ncbi:hypothetical protein ACFQX8_13115 [Klenkia terrae]|uniref:hypothetical protein n=1 Tax=Klenkia terrae TaxID=1052259 RepID=UPI00361DC57C
MNAPDVLARIAAVAALMAGSREETRFAMLADCFDDLPPEPRRQLLVKLAVREAAGWSTARLAALEARVPGAGFKPDLLIGHPVSRGRWKIDAVFDAKSRSCAGANILLAKTAFPGATRPKDLPQGVHWQWEPDPTGRIRLYVSSNHAYRRSRTWLGSDEIIDGAVVWVFGAVDPAAYAPFVPGWRQVGLESVYALLVALATAHRSASLEGAVGAWVAPPGSDRSRPSVPTVPTVAQALASVSAGVGSGGDRSGSAPGQPQPGLLCRHPRRVGARAPTDARRTAGRGDRR